MAKKTVSQAENKKAPKLSFFKKNFVEIVIFVFTVLLYSNSLTNGYNMDDELVTRNHRLTSKGIAAIPEIFTTTYYKDDAGYAYDYRPMVLATFAIEHDVFGEKPFMGHLINLILYALACLVLYRLLLSLSKDIGPLLALAITLLFVAHAAHTEAVCSIKNRDELLGVLFYFLSIYVALKAVVSNRYKKLLWVPLLFICVLLNKVTFLSLAVIIPFTLLFFTEISFVAVMLLTASLLIPVFFLVNVSSFYLLLLIVFAILAAVVTMYVIVRFAKLKDRVKLLWGNITSGNLTETIETTENDLKFFGPHIVPGAEVLQLFPALFSVLMVSLFIVGYILAINWLSIGCLILLVCISLVAGGAWRWWVDIAMYVCLMIPVSGLSIEYIRGYSNLFVFFIAYRLFWGDAKERIPIIALLIFFLAYRAFTVLNFEAFFMTFLMYLSTLKNSRRLIAAFVLVVLVGHIIKGDYINVWVITDSICLMLIALAMLLQKQALKIIWGAAAVVVGLFIWLQVNNVKSLNLNSEIQRISRPVNTFVIQQHQDRPIDFVEQPVQQSDPESVKLGTSVIVLLHYLVKTVLPYPLAFYYGYKFIEPTPVFSIFSLLGIALYGFAALAAILLYRRNRLASFAILWYLVTVVTFSNYTMMIPGIVADRYLLLPSLGWCILLAVFLFYVFKIKLDLGVEKYSTLPTIFKYAITAILLIYGGLTFSRNFDWKDDLTLFRHDISYVSESAQANNLLALHLMIHTSQMQPGPEQNAIMNEALVHFKKTLEISPKMYNATYDVARVYNLLGNKDSAVVYFDKAISIDSTYYEAHITIGQLLFQMGRPREAIPYYDYIIRNYPTEPRAYDFLSYLYFQLHEFDNSIKVNRKAIQYLPANADPLINIGRVYHMGLNNRDSAIYYYQKAYALNPLPELKQNIELLGGKISQ